jgi:hypothetical protein
VLDALGTQADGGSSGNLEESDMYTILSGEIAAQRISDLHRQATEYRLAHHGRAGRKRTAGRRRRWERLTLQRRRPAVGATQP